MANLAYLIAGSSQHRILLPTAFLLGIIALVGGQLILEHLLGMAGRYLWCSSLSVDRCLLCCY